MAGRILGWSTIVTTEFEAPPRNVERGSEKGDIGGLMPTNPSQPVPERPVPAQASSEPLDALPAREERPGPADQRPQDRRGAGSPGSKPTDPGRWPAPRGPWPAPVAGQPAAATTATATERGTGEQARVIAQERPEPALHPAAPGSPPDPQADDHRLAMLSYLGVPFLGPVIPLVIYLIKRRSSAFVRYHAAQALNLSITALLYTICVLILGTMLALDSIVVALVVGVTLAAALWLATLAFVILAGSRASRGRRYRIPGWLCAAVVR
jgi:uncharacterized protein